MANVVKVLSVGVVFDEWSKVEHAIRVCVWRRRDMPNFDLAADSNCEVSSRRRKRKSRNLAAEREVIEGYPSMNDGQNGTAILVYGEEEVALRCETEPRDVLSVSEG